MSGEGDSGDAAQPVLCPSGRCRPGALLIGIVGPDGRLGYLSPAIPVDDDFVARARAGRTPESRFRFAEPCVEGRCAQWAGDRCGLIGELLASPHAGAPEQAAPLPRCAVRGWCRWFGQRGAQACRICPLVVHTPRVPAVPAPPG